jgi:hypothetical protein
VVCQNEVRRAQLLGFIRKMAPCLIGMEARGGSAPDCLWVADIMYIAIWAAFLYLALIDA